MVTRTRLRSILTALGLYVMAALLIGYFGVNAFSGDRGLTAKQDIEQQITSLSTELTHLQVGTRPMGASPRPFEIEPHRSRHAR